MKFEDLKIGMRLDLNQREFDFAGTGRVEAVGFDWAVVRCREDEHPYLVSDNRYLAEAPKENE